MDSTEPPYVIYQKMRLFAKKSSLYKASQMFTIPEEKFLVKYLVNGSKMNLSRIEVMKLAFSSLLHHILKNLYS